MTWDSEFEMEEDNLFVGSSEIEELDNDEIDAHEAGFLKGYMEE